MTYPLVSVLVAVYNTQDYLTVCLDSILNQTCTDFEVVAIDDGSSDRSLEILREYADRDARFIVHHQENKGVGSAKSLALNMAKGKYIFVLDSDDFIEPDTLEVLTEQAELLGAQILTFYFDIFNEALNTFIDHKSCINLQHIPQQETFNARDIPSTIFQVFTPEVCNKLWLRTFLVDNKISFGEYDYAEDYYLTYWAMSIAENIAANTDKAFYHYRQGRQGSLTTSSSNPLGFLPAYAALKEKLESLDLFDLLEQSYVNQTLAGITFEFSRHAHGSVRMLVADTLRDEGLKRLGITKKDFKYYYSKIDLDLYLQIVDKKRITVPVTVYERNDSGFLKIPSRFFRHLKRFGVKATLHHLANRLKN